MRIPTLSVIGVAAVLVAGATWFATSNSNVSEEADPIEIAEERSVIVQIPSLRMEAFHVIQILTGRGDP